MVWGFLICFVSEQKGVKRFSLVMYNGGSRGGGGLHPGRLSALSRPPTRDKLRCPNLSLGPLESPRRGRAGAPSSRPAAGPGASAVAERHQHSRRPRCSALYEAPCPSSPFASRDEGEDTRGGSAAARRVCGCAGRKLHRPQSGSFQARGLPLALPADGPGSCELQRPPPRLGQSPGSSSFQTTNGPKTTLSRGGLPGPVPGRAQAGRTPRCRQDPPRPPGPSGGFRGASQARSVPLPNGSEPPAPPGWPQLLALSPSRGAAAAPQPLTPLSARRRGPLRRSLGRRLRRRVPAEEAAPQPHHLHPAAGTSPLLSAP